MIPSAASSRSALRDTIAGFLPPISTMHGRGQLVENDLNSLNPTSNEPVKTIPSMPWFDWSSSPTVSPGPMTRLTTPAGTPASSSAWMRFTAGQRRRRGGLEDDGVAGEQRAGDRARSTSAIGKLNGLMTANTPCGRSTDRVWTVDVAEVVHRVVVAVVVLDRLGVVADQVGRLLDLAERLEPVLADLERHVGAVAHLALGDELGGAAQDRQAVAPRRAAPLRRCAASRRDRRLDVRPDRPSRRCRSAGLGRSASATSKVPAEPSTHCPSMKFWWCPPSPARDSLDARLVQRVELLVVVPEGGVGDLDSRARFGGHRVSTGVGRGRFGHAGPELADCGQSTPGTTAGPLPRRAHRCALERQPAGSARMTSPRLARDGRRADAAGRGAPRRRPCR